MRQTPHVFSFSPERRVGAAHGQDMSSMDWYDTPAGVERGLAFILQNPNATHLPPAVAAGTPAQPGAHATLDVAGKPAQFHASAVVGTHETVGFGVGHGGFSGQRSSSFTKTEM